MIQGCWPDNRWFHLLSTVQNFASGRGYLRAADVSSFCTLADSVIVQMIRCTNNGRFFVHFPRDCIRAVAGLLDPSIDRGLSKGKA